MQQRSAHNQAASPGIKVAGQPAPPAPADSQLKEKVDRLEKEIETMEKAGPPSRGSTHEALLQDEMGSVEGVILWNGRPLQNAKVKMVPGKAHS